MPTFQNVAIVGVGLIGGSIGLALHEGSLATEVVGVGRRQSSLDKAQACGAVDRTTTDLEAGVAAADVVIVATPVATVSADVCRSLAVVSAEALVTDVGSTKQAICEEVKAIAPAANGQFVGSHPLAGDHRSGPENARGNLLQDKVVVITPAEETPSETADRAQQFWEALGARVVRMTPQEHDEALASTSHLPHLLAAALAACTPEKWLPLTATGWADTTRVAAADAELWTAIFTQNKVAVSKALRALIEQLQNFQKNIDQEDWVQIQDSLQQAKRIRDALGN